MRKEACRVLCGGGSMFMASIRLSYYGVDLDGWALLLLLREEVIRPGLSVWHLSPAGIGLKTHVNNCYKSGTLF